MTFQNTNQSWHRSWSHIYYCSCFAHAAPNSVSLLTGWRGRLCWHSSHPKVRLVLVSGLSFHLIFLAYVGLTFLASLWSWQSLYYLCRHFSLAQQMSNISASLHHTVIPKHKTFHTPLWCLQQRSLRMKTSVRAWKKYGEAELHENKALCYQCFMIPKEIHQEKHI